jgi:3-oxoacyl-[acyl-carrier protein] reductase
VSELRRRTGRSSAASDRLVTNGRLRGRVVLITGAASGIGLETARRAAAEGADIAAIGLASDDLEAVVDDVRRTGQRAAFRAADVSDADAISAAVDELVVELGGLHIAFANAGMLVGARTIDEFDLDEWNRVIAVDLTGVMLTFRAAVNRFGDGGGVLLATGSSLAARPGTGYLPYVAAKAGMHAVVRSLALELAPFGIRANVIVPGLTDTPMTRGVPGHIERQLPSVPLGELVDAGHVAALAIHLMSDEARSITGSTFTIDGGRTAV